jgi:hypothetical protein
MDYDDIINYSNQPSSKNSERRFIIFDDDCDEKDEEIKRLNEIITKQENEINNLKSLMGAPLPPSLPDRSLELNEINTRLENINNKIINFLEKENIIIGESKED